ncbi:HIRAN domain-containing protein [Sphingobium sp. CECT 9361]|uniref:HIRAN domain-containing protein n=1 Tax=Sphingobium sp. CECT 9361 TaxID=2845384 RepID=UPI001E5894C2|nr:HIRAN domain-containing protein [Sphingobium sp. CECT 9361]
MRQLSLAVVGAQFSNANAKGPTRLFEIRICAPGEHVDLIPEPRNPADPRAIAVYSCRGIQLGYLTAERAPWIGNILRQGLEIRAIFQSATQSGAIIRATLDGSNPALPPPPPARPAADDDFWPDYIPPDE